MRGRLTLPGGEVEFDILGDRRASRAADGPALVLLHEGLGSLDLWRRFPGVLASLTGRMVLVWSRYGYGRSAVVAEPRAVSYMHEEALGVLPHLLDRLGIERPALVGHSDGASIALIHAGAGIRPVAGVVALAPHVMVEERSLAGIRAARHEYLHGDLPARLARYHTDPDATFWGWNDVWLSEPFRAWSIEAYLPHDRLPGPARAVRRRPLWHPGPTRPHRAPGARPGGAPGAAGGRPRAPPEPPGPGCQPDRGLRAISRLSAPLDAAAC